MSRCNEGFIMLIIIVGGSCVGKSSLERILVDELDFSPLNILTTRSRREDDPSWVTCDIDDEYPYHVDKYHKITGVNGHHYLIELPHDDDNYVTSVIDVVEAFRINNIYKSTICLLDRCDGEVWTCINNRDISIDEKVKRYNQFINIRNRYYKDPRIVFKDRLGCIEYIKKKKKKIR